jgi:lysozyme family protein
MNVAERRTDARDGYPPPALTAAVLALIAVVLAVWAVAATAETLARATESYTPVEAAVVGEHTELRLVADRRGSSPEPFRVVTVELPDGARADVRSDDLALGATAMVFRSDSGAVFETRPARPGPLEWTLCAAIVAAAIVLARASVRTVRRRPRSASSGSG